MTGGDTWAGQRLKALRLKKKLKQDELADRAGIARETLNKLENGNRELTAYYAAKLAPVLGVKESALVRSAPVTKLPATDPLVLLGELSKTVETLELILNELKGRVETLEQKPAARRRTSQGS